MRTYADLEIGVVDCAVLAVTERLGESKLATPERRHFGTMRPRHVDTIAPLAIQPSVCELIDAFAARASRQVSRAEC